MRAVFASPAAIRWLVAMPIAMLVAISLITIAVPEPAQASELPPPPGPGCTWAPDFPFYPECVEHDDCYSPDSHLSRRQCDDNFRSGMHHACSTDAGAELVLLPYPGGCDGVAETYYWAVRLFGESHYDGQGGDGYDDEDDDDDDGPPPPPPPG